MKKRNNVWGCARYLWVAGVFAALCGACGDSEDTDDAPSPSVEPSTEPSMEPSMEPEQDSATLTVTTFNAGLARGFVPYADERLPFISPGVLGLESDVVCLQEVWDDDQIARIEEETGDTFPHRYFAKTVEEAGDPACTEEDTTDLVACVEENCADVVPDDLAGCVLGSCGEQFMATESDCQSCAVSNLGQSFEEILNVCLTSGATLAYGGHNGLMILSKLPLQTTEFRTLPSTVTQRAILRAQVEVSDGIAEVFCTHLAADLSALIEYPEGEFASFEEEQAAQIELLHTYMDEADEEAPVIVLGDFNTGPDGDSFDAELPENYDALLRDGLLASPYAEADDAECTFCFDNALVGEGQGGGGVLLDHVLLLRAESMRAWRTLDETQTIETMADGERELPLSDHYGVCSEVVITPFRE